MARRLRILLVTLLLASITIQADPMKEWRWTGPTTYANGTTIPPEDNLSFMLYCGTSPGGPYPFEMAIPKPSPSTVDMVNLVQGQPGSWFCALTATSSIHNTESDLSNEINFVVQPSDLGLRPLPPVLLVQ